MKRVLTVFMTCFAVCIVILMGCDDTATNPQEETTKMALVYPEGGETFSIGDTVTISFKANGDSISSIGIQVTSDGFNYFHVINKSIPITTSGIKTYTQQWYIGHEEEYDTALLYAALDFADGSDPEWTCKIKIYVYDNPNVFIQSGDFTVNFKRPFFLRYPIGGEEYDIADTVPIVATYRSDSMSIIQYFFWSIEEGDWSQIVKVNEITRQDDYKLITFTKKFIPADSSSFPYPLGDSTKVMINDYSIKRPMESGWIRINK